MADVFDVLVEINRSINDLNYNLKRIADSFENISLDENNALCVSADVWMKK